MKSVSKLFRDRSLLLVPRTEQNVEILETVNSSYSESKTQAMTDDEFANEDIFQE